MTKINKINEAYNNVLNETSLSRLFKHMNLHDTGIITAYRVEEFDDSGNKIKTYTKKENQQRNKDLLPVLKSLGYDVISIQGTYIENFGSQNAKESSEHSFFVVDKNDNDKLRKNLIKLGKHFNQDSIIFIPQSGRKGQLIGTKDDEYSNQFAYPGLRKVISYNNIKFGENSEFMSKTNNRPFVFESIGAELNNFSMMTRMGMLDTAKKISLLIDEEIYKDISRK